MGGPEEAEAADEPAADEPARSRAASNGPAESEATAGGSRGDARFDVPLRGVGVDDETRCMHYRTARDVIAIRFPCCETFFPCFECHAACCEHDTERWPPDRFDERAVLCGACREVLTVDSYLASDHECSNCGASFNPGCVDHYDRYFAVGTKRDEQ
jgi:uncharacterized CHY-type Zn-finger protein